MAAVVLHNHIIGITSLSHVDAVAQLTVGHLQA